MDMHTSHLAAALLSGSNSYSNIIPDPNSSISSMEGITPIPIKSKADIKSDNAEEEKEEIASGEEFSDEDNQSGNKSTPGRGVTLQMLLEEKMLEPGIAAMTIEYLGQKFVGDLQADGKIKSHETETVFCSPSAWAIHCKRIINPDKRSGCGWASVKYKGKKLDTIKATYLRRKQLQRENIHTDEEVEMEVESLPEPPPQRVVMKHNTVPNRMMQHDANMLIEAVSFASVGKVQPFLVSISSNACLVLDLHCHLKKEEMYGYLAGTWDLNCHNVIITHAFPCLISKKDPRPNVLVELEIQMEVEKLGLTLLGWYHSHPTNPAMPSLRDCDNQLDYQIKLRGPSEISYTPCVGIICSPYNPESPVLESSVTCFWVMPPPEQRPTEYPRPLHLQYNMMNDSHLSTHAVEQIKRSIKYYTTFADDTIVKFKDNYKPDITYLDKLKCTLTPKFPREQSDGLLWHFIRDELGCSSDQDDKIDLDALLAVPQQIPVCKPQSSSASFPSVSTLQQMVSRPAGVPPINVSSGIGSLSPNKFETPTHLNIPVLPTSSKSSKSSSSSMPSGYPTGLEMLTSMALGLGTGSNMSLPLSATSLESLAAANSMLTGLPPGISTSLAATLTGTKMPDPPSYAASLQNLTNSLGSYEKSSSSSSTTSSSATPIPASIASNLMMSSADIANALLSASKYSSAGILGIPDPMSKSTLAANNMFLSPSLMKMQESLMKPLSGSSSSISSKAGLDPSLTMKSHDSIKNAKDYLPPDFNLSGTKAKADKTSENSYKSSESSYKASESSYKVSESSYKPSDSSYKSSESSYKPSESSYKHSESSYKPSETSYKQSEPSSYKQSDQSSYKQSDQGSYKPSDSSYKQSEPSSYKQSDQSSYKQSESSSYKQSDQSSHKQTDVSSYKQSDHSSYKQSDSSIKCETAKADTGDIAPTDFSMSSSQGSGESFLSQMLELTKKTTMPDYMSDYSQPPLKLSKPEDYCTSLPASVHPYSSTSSIVDTIAQVAMGNFNSRDEPTDYSSEQDYSATKRPHSDSEQ